MVVTEKTMEIAAIGTAAIIVAGVCVGEHIADGAKKKRYAKHLEEYRAYIDKHLDGRTIEELCQDASIFNSRLDPVLQADAHRMLKRYAPKETQLVHRDSIEKWQAQYDIFNEYRTMFLKADPKTIRRMVDAVNEEDACKAKAAEAAKDRNAELEKARIEANAKKYIADQERYAKIRQTHEIVSGVVDVAKGTTVSIETEES